MINIYYMIDERRYIIYCHTSPNGKLYYGQTCRSFEIRCGLNGMGYCDHSHFWNAIRKYGWNNIKHEILFDNLTQEEANILEMFYIWRYNTMNSKIGYNKSSGGESPIFSKETKLKHSIQTKRMWKNLEYKNRLSKIQRKSQLKRYEDPKEHIKTSEGQRRRYMNYEERKKTSDAIKNYFINNPEAHKLMSENRKKYHMEHPERRQSMCKKVAQYDLEDNLIKIWNSQVEAEQTLGFKARTIGSCCRNIRKTAHGFIWKFIEN